MSKELRQRLTMSLLGVVMSGAIVGLFRTARLGVDPFQSLMSGINAVIPISFGTLYMIVNALLLLFSLLLDRSKIGIATFINLFLLGYVAEYSEKGLSLVFPAPSLPLRVLLLCIALVLGCLAAALYFNANLGVSTYDAVALVASQRQSRIPFRLCRILSDLFCVLLGAALMRLAGYDPGRIWGFIGAGTLITAFFMGPLISLFSAHLPDYTRHA